MLSLFKSYKNFIICAVALGLCTVAPSVKALEEIQEVSEKDVMESPISNEEIDSSTSYINDIEILGANIIKPEFVLKKISLKKGDLYDKEIVIEVIEKIRNEQKFNSLEELKTQIKDLKI